MELPQDANLTIVKREPRPYGDEFWVYAIDKAGNVWRCTETRNGVTGDVELYRAADETLWPAQTFDEITKGAQ